MSKKKPVRKGFYRSYATEDEYETSCTDEIYQCDDDSPPSRVTPRVKELCTIHSTIDAPWSALETYVGENGKQLRKLSYDIEMKPSGASNEFTVLFNDVQVGSQNATVEFS